jgi:hypothetical protein
MQLSVTGVNMSSDLSLSVGFKARADLVGFIGLNWLMPIKLATSTVFHPSG